MSSKLALSMLTSATEEVTTSSGSDDVDARAPANVIPYSYSGTCANSQYSGKKLFKIVRNNFSTSSIGPNSK